MLILHRAVLNSLHFEISMPENFFNLTHPSGGFHQHIIAGVIKCSIAGIVKRGQYVQRFITFRERCTESCCSSAK